MSVSTKILNSADELDYYMNLSRLISDEILSITPIEQGRNLYYDERVVITFDFYKAKERLLKDKDTIASVYHFTKMNGCHKITGDILLNWTILKGKLPFGFYIPLYFVDYYETTYL